MKQMGVSLGRVVPRLLGRAAAFPFDTLKVPCASFFNPKPTNEIYEFGFYFDSRDLMNQTDGQTVSSGSFLQYELSISRQNSTSFHWEVRLATNRVERLVVDGIFQVLDDFDGWFDAIHVYWVYCNCFGCVWLFWLYLVPLNEAENCPPVISVHFAKLRIWKFWWDLKGQWPIQI